MEIVEFYMILCFTLKNNSKKNDHQVKRKNDKLLSQLDLGICPIFKYVKLLGGEDKQTKIHKK